MCSYPKCIFWQRGAEPTCKGPERHLRRPRSPTWTSPQLTTSAFLESSTFQVQVFVTYCANATTKPVRRSLPQTRSSFSAFSFTGTHIVKVTSKGATTTPPIPSPSHPRSRRQDSRSELWKARRTEHENKESISKKLSLLILNLEEGDITLSPSTNEAVQLLLDLSSVHCTVSS